jgi:hypothetical protein
VFQLLSLVCMFWFRIQISEIGLYKIYKYLQVSVDSHNFKMLFNLKFIKYIYGLTYRIFHVRVFWAQLSAGVHCYVSEIKICVMYVYMDFF